MRDVVTQVILHGWPRWRWYPVGWPFGVRWNLYEKQCSRKDAEAMVEKLCALAGGVRCAELLEPRVDLGPPRRRIRERLWQGMPEPA